jgi:hypothetical protein
MESWQPKYKKFVDFKELFTANADALRWKDKLTETPPRSSWEQRRNKFYPQIGKRGENKGMIWVAPSTHLRLNNPQSITMVLRGEDLFTITRSDKVVIHKPRWGWLHTNACGRISRYTGIHIYEYSQIHGGLFLFLRGGDHYDKPDDRPFGSAYQTRIVKDKGDGSQWSLRNACGWKMKYNPTTNQRDRVYIESETYATFRTREEAYYYKFGCTPMVYDTPITRIPNSQGYWSSCDPKGWKGWNALTMPCMEKENKRDG